MPLYEPPVTGGSGGGDGAAWGEIAGTLSDQTDLQAELDGKEAANANIQAHIAAAHAPSDAQKNSDITKAEIEAKLTGEISSHSHAGGGSDPWTVVVLESDFTTASSTAVDVGLGFTPAADTRYIFDGMLLCRTTLTTTGPRPCLIWPTGGADDGIATLNMTNSNTTQLIQNGNPAAALVTANGGLPSTNRSYPALVQGSVLMGSSPSGDLKISLATETAGTDVSVRAGSYLRYRTY